MQPQPSKLKLNISKEDLDWATQEGLITQSQTEQLWNTLVKRQSERPERSQLSQFDLTHLFWYVGALLIFLAMGWFCTEMGLRYGPFAVFATSAAYLTAFLAGGSYLWFKKNLQVPGGLLITLSTLLVPLVVSSLADGLGLPLDYYLPYEFFLILMDSLIIGAALLALCFFAFPLLTAPIAVGLCLMSIPISNFFLPFSGLYFGIDKEQLALIMLFGLTVTVIGFLIDLKRYSQDYSFWFYLAGVLTFWLALTTLIFTIDTEWAYFIYFLINIALMLKSVLFSRSIFLICGSLGALFYLSHIAATFFAGSVLFPFALTLIGIGVIWMGVQYRKNQAAIEKFILSLVPASLRNLLPRVSEDSSS